MFASRRVMAAIGISCLLAPAAFAMSLNFEEIEVNVLQMGRKTELRLEASDAALFALDTEDSCSYASSEGMRGRIKLIPTAYSAEEGAEYRVRGNFSLNFERIEAKGEKARIRTRIRGEMTCEPVDSTGQTSCIGSYSAKGQGGRNRIRATVHHEFDAAAGSSSTLPFFIDDIIVGAHVLEWEGTCRTRGR